MGKFKTLVRALAIPAAAASFIPFALGVCSLGVTARFHGSNINYEAYIFDALFVILWLGTFAMSLATLLLPHWRFGIPYLIWSSLTLGFSFGYALFWSPYMRNATALKSYTGAGAADHLAFSTGIIGSVLGTIPVAHAGIAAARGRKTSMVKTNQPVATTYA
ncbi:predicted protein [Naegleria gruberi]|uniref:Predicted protein n=1 Tax=Naegleria gruberi TaxID=5762 RepID=D2W3W9_NAEGR|nr:uncharacterized protein NAEGRDRAFT_76095 [Naegleria gruberi]EFC36246.1 predicted protein [Naegleria gruberi]|eukprot:XP_002668990.1 predicted protein [Naegleria gruberi strain NEG-M]